MPADIPLRRPSRHSDPEHDLELLVSREWLVTNGLGGYSSGTVAGATTRRYHGLLVAALPNPLGRTVMLTELAERVVTPSGERLRLGAEERVETKLVRHGTSHLRDFRLEWGLPVWEYEVDGHLIERRLVMPHRQNTTIVQYRLLRGDGPLALELQPAVNFRAYEAPVSTPLVEGYSLRAEAGHYVLSGDPALPPLRVMVHGGQPSLTLREERVAELLHRVEAARGYEFAGALWTPGWLTVELREGAPASLVASTEGPEVMSVLSSADAIALEQLRRRRLLDSAHPCARTGGARELVLAADQFVISPAGRVADRVRAWATGDDVRTVIAGYHWFTDWGRDTMISLEGLTLATGRQREAAAILREFAHHVRDGLIPNMFPDGSNEGLYHTADATLWFFHAAERYLRDTRDEAMLAQLVPIFQAVVDHHLRGTHFGIRVDPADGLLTQGMEGYQLTWMDAKVDGWVVTPRRGKAVELNALWYNALSLLAGWWRTLGDDARADAAAGHAARARESFNARFWIPDVGYLYDVVDGPDGDSVDCRPNQLFAISLDHPVLARERWEPVLEVVRERLLTPVGLRSLAPGSPDYRPTYHGDLRTRDAAYHQGTVWGWLIGPWVDAWLRVHPDDQAGARRFLEPLVAHLDEFGVGSIAEIFDAEPPFTPRGCIAQAWSVAEALRCWVKTESSGERRARSG